MTVLWRKAADWREWPVVQWWYWRQLKRANRRAFDRECREGAAVRATCIRIVKHVVHCRDCGETWVDEDEECTCTCTGPESETWIVAELCADCGQPLDGHPDTCGRTETGVIDEGGYCIPGCPDDICRNSGHCAWSDGWLP